jgi:hypothetical protein
MNHLHKGHRSPDTKQRSLEVNPSALLNLDDAFEQSQWMNNKVFSDAELARLEAEFDHDPNAAIAWMAATSPASFGYRSCSMDEQLEAILGKDGSKVVPPGIRERTVEAMKLAMDCRQIRACAACGFRGYQTGRAVNVDCDLQDLEMSDVALQQFEASSRMIQTVTSSTLRLGKRYHLHQELVSENGDTWICDACTKKNPLSLKAGVDYGRLSRVPGLSTLTAVEQALVANNRFYATTLQCSLGKQSSGSKMKGHVMCVQQDSLKKMASTFAERCKDVVQDFTVIFQGPRSLLQHSHVAGSMATLVSASQENIKRHFNVFSELMPNFYPPDLLKDIVHSQLGNDVALADMCDNILSAAICVDDEHVLRQSERMAALLTDNVATSEAMMAEAGDFGFPHLCILPRHAPSGVAEVQEAAASAVCNALGIQQRPSPIIMTGVAVNEFDSNDSWCVGSFPWLFPLGPEAAKLPKGPLNAKVRRHILNQYHCAAGQDMRLLFGFANQAQRHDALRSISKQRVSGGKLQEFAETMTSERFLRDVIFAKEGDADAVRAVVGKVAPMIEVAMGSTSIGASERARCVQRVYALNYYYGPPCLFFTFSPDAVHDPSSVMMSFPSNASFDHDVFLRDFADSGTFSLGAGCTSINFGTANLKRLYTANPVAAAESFNRKFDVIIEEFFGFKPAVKRSKAPGTGMLGRSFAHYSVVEAQGRGTLHVHLLFWGSFCPQLIQAAATSVLYRDIVSQALESMFKCELPRQTHMERLELRARIAQMMEGSCLPPAVSRSPDAISCHSYEERAHAAALESNIHHHTFTCHKGKKGKRQCRMCMPAGRLDQTVFTFVQQAAQHPFYSVSSDIPEVDSACTPGRDLNHYPLPAIDHRLISWGARRRRLEPLTPHERARLEDDLPLNSVDWLNSVLPLQNGLVSAFNPEIMAVFACNQNFAITGSSVDAKDVTFYIAKYMQKDSHALAATASAFFLAQDHVQKFPSVAGDADTSLRKAQYLLTSTINRIEGAIELSQDQAANLALGFQADQCNWKF